MLTKPRDPARMSDTSMYSRKQRRFSPLLLIGVTVTILVALIGIGVVVVLPHFQSKAADTPNMDCTLIVPANPLSAQGASDALSTSRH